VVGVSEVLLRAGFKGTDLEARLAVSVAVRKMFPSQAELQKVATGKPSKWVVGEEFEMCDRCR
jgi:hypothetical protein